MPPAPGNSPGYIHSFTQSEQERLLRQGVFLEPYVFAAIDFSRARHVLEVGCGVGAQMAVMLRRWPALNVTGIDRAAVQIDPARGNLKAALTTGRAHLCRGEGTRLPFPDRSFDGAFVCWVLEHAADPVGILQDIRRVLAPGAALYATEVFNSGMRASPRCPATEIYWREFNRYQRDLGGDPDAGAKLEAHARAAGFADVAVRELTPRLDRTTADPAARREFMAMWIRLLLSAAAALVAEGRVEAGVPEAMARELAALADNPDAEYVYAARQVKAVV